MKEDGVYFCDNESIYRELNGEYLIFSGLSRETLVVQRFVFDLLSFLGNQEKTYQDIERFFDSKKNHFDIDDDSAFILDTLERLISCGVINYSERSVEQKT